MIKKLPLLLLLLCNYHELFCQTGPAGVGTSTNNALWLKADAGTSSTLNAMPVSYWNDQSGNGIHVTQTVSAQQPSFATNLINGFPAIQFDDVNSAGFNDKMIGPDSPLLDNTSGYTFFTVTHPQILDGNARAIISKRTAVSVDQSFMLFYYTANKLHVDIQTTDNRFASNVTFSTGIDYLTSVTYNGAVTTSSLRCNVYSEETLDRSATETNSIVPDNPSPLLIGTTDAGDSRPFGGYMSEIIIYREELHAAARIIVNNYLSAKYNIALSVNDKYLGDTPANGDYDRQVAGIGQESTGSNTSFSASVSGGLTIVANSGLDNGDYVLAGHAVPANTTTTTDVGGMTGAANARWQRNWYIDVTNTSTNMNANIEFDMSDGGMGAFVLGTYTNYVLLYRPGQSGNWTELASATGISGDIIQFNNIVLTNDGYYTVGTRNLNPSPLPIELLYFNAIAGDNAVALDWATASEKSTKQFIVEKTSNGIDYKHVCTMTPTGESTSKKSYRAADLYPFTGISYYRLKEISNSNKTTCFPLVAIFIEAGPAFVIFPNPSENIFNIKINAPENTIIHIQVRDFTGRLCLEKTVVTTYNNELLFFEAADLPGSGTYLVRVSAPDKTFTQKIILK